MTTGADSLLAMSRRCATRNIETLYDVGPTHPYSFWRPILLKIENPDQLKELETTCPQLHGETGEIWQRFIKRDILGWETKRREPADPKNWWKLYRKLKADAEREKQAQEDELRERMRKLNEDKQANTSIIVEARTGYTPRPQRRFGVPTGPRPPPAAKNARTALDKLKRSMYDQNQARPKAAMMPNRLLEERRGRVVQAPKSMVEDNKVQVGAPRTKTWTSKAPGTATSGKDSNTSTANAADLAAREVRLRALTGGGNGTSNMSSPAPGPYSMPSADSFRARVLENSPASPAPKKRRRPEVNPFMTAPKRSKP
jgi:elongin-A